uniref:Uncharacterized protein n=1 Tax=Chromera velia CCMP2878 TaxID=1169474 RepID=A0A0G4HPJ3_9ALVE|mmetsp:Transcript_20102/g.40355  ORF Transcript_20102/g.40355 Transcript_20102/m.40355 type:complete len:307 (-) Transcript_20102:224-1144(-)|eukprot:Cvel_7760.t1-p1 / transcript=Cvel_7760.t1 / gene=Cvel_7760 / organism=Chromera_velia_CCMP2878 / gene_product=Dehydrogenase/reductase SDR family protein 7-like, putative / transcript_product=Dehydrogenase/reductase SDR family protein 7-like, putative / location=Cvel_scaffold413:55603-59808(-) / protein_length=306 / sequence_SO=supercontig / SO=protein_coding / is_pseudo=false
MGNNPSVLRIFWTKFSADSVIIITGASMGIGKELAVRYAARGSSLVLFSRNLTALETVAKECQKTAEKNSKTCEVLCVAGDVTREEDCARMVERAVERFGRIDLLVLNAGITAHHPFSADADMRTFKKLLDVNFLGCVYCTKAAFPWLVDPDKRGEGGRKGKGKREKGQILVISSMGGELGAPLRTAYCASKFALTGFFEALRMEKGDKVDITIVCPPAVKTDFRKNAIGYSEEEEAERRRQHPEFFRKGNQDKRMAVEAAVDTIMLAADKRARKVMFPLRAYVAVYVRPFIPDLIDPLLISASKL